jgi:alkylation response protein AidB-like acyl-CoA dehydrogenase
MDLGLTDDQELLRSTTRAFLERESPLSRVRALITDDGGFDPKAWKQGAELGWFSLLVPEVHGGGSVSGNGIHDLALIARELGRLLFPGPVLETNIVAWALACFGSPRQQAEWLPRIVAGDTIAVWVTGDGALVQDAQAADVLLVSSGDGTHHLVDASAVPVERLESLDLTRRFARLDPANTALGGAAAERLPGTGELLDLAAVLQCAELVGAVERLFEITREYSLDRFAFGRPIGSFQAVKHQLAEMLGWLESSKAIVGAAAKSLDAELASTAKYYVGTHAPLIARACLQLHGGIAYTWEHDLHLYLRRVESSRAIHGSPEEHLDRLATVLAI